MARHVYYLPDCPECGAEMTKRSTFNGGWTAWWHCGHCGHETEHVEHTRMAGDPFEELTEGLVAGLRMPGDPVG